MNLVLKQNVKIPVAATLRGYWLLLTRYNIAYSNVLHEIFFTVWQEPWGDSVPYTELELSVHGLQYSTTDHHHCGRGGQQGAAQDWQQTHCGPLQVSSTSHHYQHMMILSSRRQWHCQQVRDVLCHSYHHWSLQDWECGGCVPGGEGPAYPEARSCSHSGEYHITQTSYHSTWVTISFTTGSVPVRVWGCAQIPGVLWNILQL